MRRLLLATIAALLIAGCDAIVPTTPPTTPPIPTAAPLGRPLGPGELAVPVELWEPINGVPQACGGVGFAADYRLHGSPTDPRVVWMITPDGSRLELAWPLGYSARFTPALELLDEQGVVVAREGSRVDGGCRTPHPPAWWVDLERATPEPSADIS